MKDYRSPLYTILPFGSESTNLPAYSPDSVTVI